jgi:uncharacterized protein (TIGR00299 family) protein
MKIAYFDCFSGICGDMILGALFDLGLDQNFFRKEIKKIDLTGFEIDIKEVERNHLHASDVNINVTEQQPHRSFKDIKRLIQGSKLDRKIKRKSIEIFQKLAKAEGRIHNVTFESVHFHEIGAVDSIIDIVGTVIGIEKFEFDKIFSSPLPLGKGFVNCAHGKIPIPAPATLEILKDVPVYQTERKQELVTPTGAAIISSFAHDFIDIPPMKIKRIGHGAGKTKSKYPNILRVIIGEGIDIKIKKN